MAKEFKITSLRLSELEKELKEAAAKGAEELKAKLKEQIGGAFDSVPTADGSSSTATDNAVCSLLSWAYSDYLRIFVVIGLLAKLPLIGWLFGLLGGLVGLYATVGIIVAILVFFKVLK